MSDPTVHTYNPGDIVNGHTLVQSADGSVEWVPNAAPVASARKWYTKKRFLIPGGVLVLLIVIGSINRPSTKIEPVADRPAAIAAETQDVEEVAPVTASVPDVTGLTATDAIRILRAAGFKVVDIDDPSNATVTGTTPAAGGVAEEGSTVTLTVAVKPQLTLAQQNAVASGESYLAYTSFSRSGLIGQLEYEGFSTADATFAVDAIAPDWNVQAGLSAKSYLEYSSFSRQGLYDQLIYEGFSDAEANAGLAAVGY